MDIGILFVFAIGSLTVYGIILGGWSGNNKYSLLGSLRSSAQIISYEIPLGMSILGLLLYTGSLNLERVIDWQVNNGWFILYQPLAFLLFMTSVYAECNRLPFDLPEAEQELVGGYHTEYNSFGFALFAMGEYTHMITTSFLMSIAFFGGWHFPGLSDIGGLIGVLIKFGILGAKATIFLLLFQLALDHSPVPLRSTDGTGLAGAHSAFDSQPSGGDDRSGIQTADLGDDGDFFRAVFECGSGFDEGFQQTPTSSDKGAERTA